jgi:hypothetical protein
MSRTVGVVVLAALMIFVFATASASAAAPQPGSSPDWSSVDGAAPYGGGHAIPLEAAEPAGDSGSAVRVNTGMQAAGDLTHVVVDTDWLPSYIAGTRMGRILQIAGQPLANSPLC